MKAKELYLKKELSEFDVAVAKTFLANLIGESKVRSMKLFVLTYMEFEGNKVNLNEENNFKYLELREDIYIQGVYFSKIAFMAGNGDIIISLIDDDFNNVAGINITQALGISQADEYAFNREKNHYQKENKTNYNSDSYNENEKEDSYDYYYDNYEKNDSRKKTKKNYKSNRYENVENSTYPFNNKKPRKNKSNRCRTSNHKTKNDNTYNNNNLIQEKSSNTLETSNKNNTFKTENKIFLWIIGVVAFLILMAGFINN